MKLETLKHYIKHTNIPYHEIYDRAKRGGLEVTYKDIDRDMVVATAKDTSRHFVSSCFPRATDSRDKCCANWNEYSF